MQWWKSAVISCCALLLGATGCNLEFKPRGWKPTPLPMPAPVPVATGPLAISALPAYRLVTSPLLVDAPSRLLVIQVRLSSTDDRALSLTPEDLAVVLPTGEPRRVFDRGRALELLRRTMLAQGDLSYARGDSYLPSGLDDSARPQLTDMVMSNLLTQGPLTRDYTVQGYVVVDTGVALSSLNGASLEVVAHRLSDAEPARGIYPFAVAVPAAAEVAAADEVRVPTPAAVAAEAPAADALPTPTAAPPSAEPAAADAVPPAAAMPVGAETPAADAVPSVAAPPAEAPAAEPARTADQSGRHQGPRGWWHTRRLALPTPTAAPPSAEPAAADAASTAASTPKAQ